MTEDQETRPLLLLRDLSWRDHAACIGKQEFFFSDYKAKLVREAKRICSSCQVREQCLDYAMRHQEYGVWGGMTANERRVARRRLKMMMRLVK